MNKRGRKSKADNVLENLETVKSLARQGYSEKEIANHLGVGASTFSKYVSDFPELKKALQESRQKAIEDLENIAFKTAMGYDYTEEKIVLHLDENGNPTKKAKEIYNKKALPNPAMQMYLLNNWTKGKYTKDVVMAQFKEEELKLKRELAKLKDEW